MKYYCVKQHDITDCGAACIAAVAKQYGLDLPVSKIREAAGTDKQGTTVYGVIKAAEKFGFAAKGVKGSRDAFFSGFSIPAIAHIVVDGRPLHYLVIHKVSKEEILVADPAKGLIKFKSVDFFKVWTGALIIIVPNSGFRTGIEKIPSLSAAFSKMRKWLYFGDF